MGGGAVGTARVRIKGRKLSVIRFLLLSIAYTTPWIIMLSQLAYYSKIYGPQVLLQLNIAYYLPSIPILLLAGHVEKLLDEQFGSTASMAIRLTVGLSGCAAIAASYPFIPARLNYLLWVVVALGSISAVAFSTSYQLVAWFRSADTIALGIGCVASGPLALIIQLALQIGTTPKRWQWIGLFEAAAGLVMVGLLVALSLFWQYWGILSGTEPYNDSSMPLLDSAEQAQQEHADNEAGEQALMLSRMLTMQDPFQGFPFTTTPGLAYPYLQPLLRRAASDDLSEYRRQTQRAHTANTLNRHHTTTHRNSAQRAAAAAAAGQSLLMRKSAASNITQQGLQHMAVHQQQGGESYALGGNREEAAGTAGYQYYQTDAATAALDHPSPASVWWPDVERLSGPVDGAVSIPSSVHSISRPASPSPIPSAKLSSYVDDLPDFGDLVKQRRQQQQRHVATSAPVVTIAPLLGSDEEEELLLKLTAAAAARDMDVRELGDEAATVFQYDEAAASPTHSQRSAAAAALRGPRVGLLVGSPLQRDRTLAAWDNSGASQRSRSSSVSPARTPQAAAAAAAATFSQDQAAAASSKQQTRQFYQQQQAAAGKPPLPAASMQQLQQELQQLLQQPQHKRNASTGSACSAFSAVSAQSQSAFDSSDAEKGLARVGSAGGISAAGDIESSAKSDEEVEAHGGVYMEVFGYTWMVVLAALISSTLLNCIFPFFTYVESSGMLGEFLPQVLFYTRMLSDIVGRMVPRKKALAITSPVALLSLSGALLLGSAGFFTYLQAPPRMQYDPYVLLLVLLLWLAGGYINTMGYILAPCLVPAHLCTKAAAVMVLVYKASHILGLLAAISIALWLYGDISGAL